MNNVPFQKDMNQVDTQESGIVIAATEICRTHGISGKIILWLEEEARRYWSL